MNFQMITSSDDMWEKVSDTMLLLIFELIGKVQNVYDLFGAEIKQLQ